MTLADRLSRGLKATFGADLVDKLANAALIVVLTRVLLSPEEYGQLNFVLSALGVLTVVATLGLPKSAARYVTEFVETKPGYVPHVITLSATYLAVLVLGVAVATVVFGDSIARLLGTPALTAFVGIGSAYIVTRSATSYCSALFQGFNRVTWSAALSTLTGVGRLVFVTAFVALGFGVAGALVGYLAASLVAAAFGLVVLYRRFYTSFDPADARPDDLRRRLLEYSIPLTATRSANVLNNKIDTLLVGILLNMTAVGYYTIAKQISDFAATPAAAVGYTVSPAIGEQQSGENAERASRLYERSLESVLVLYLPAAAGLFLVANPLVTHVFGTDYQSAVPVVQVFSLFLLVSAVNNVTSDGLDFLGRARSRAIIKTAMAATNAGLNVLLLPIFGVVGAAVATVLTFGVYTAANVYFIHQELSLDLRALARIAGVVTVVTIGMAAVVWTARSAISGVLTLTGVILLGVTVWFALATLSGILNPREVIQFLT